MLRSSMAITVSSCDIMAATRPPSILSASWCVLIRACASLSSATKEGRTESRRLSSRSDSSVWSLDGFGSVCMSLLVGVEAYGKSTGNARHSARPARPNRAIDCIFW